MLTTEILFDYDPMVDDERRVSSGGAAAAAAAEAPEQAAAAAAAGASAEPAGAQAGDGHLVGSKVKKHFSAYTYAGKQHPAAWFDGEVIETFLKVRLRCSLHLSVPLSHVSAVGAGGRRAHVHSTV